MAHVESTVGATVFKTRDAQSSTRPESMSSPKEASSETAVVSEDTAMQDAPAIVDSTTGAAASDSRVDNGPLSTVAKNEQSSDSISSRDDVQEDDLPLVEDASKENAPQAATAVDSAKELGEPDIALVPHTMTKDRTLREFLGMMDQYAPIIPDAVTDYYLGLAGFECEDPRIKRLLALATQKFIADIAQDAYQYSKIRASGSGAAGTSIPTQPRGRYAKDRGRAVLTMEDLGSAAQEYGINLKRQDFMR